MEFSFDNMCRTCMNEGGTMVSIYGIENQIDNCRYADMFTACTSILVDENDGLPKHLCKHCLKQLVAAFSFKQQSEQSDATLREITKNPDIEFIKEEIPETYSDADESIKEESTEELTDFKLTAEFLDDEYILPDDEDSFPVAASESNNLIDLERIKRSILKPRARPRQTKFAQEAKCTYCELKFKNTQTLRQHHRTHHGKKLFCELCGKEFRSTHGLGYHMKIHKGIKNYLCTFENCDKKFRLKQALDKHMSIHNNEKNHLCSLCGKTYSTYDALHYHLKTHRGERPYLCMYCGKTFKQSCHLKSHMWVHSGIKPHQCKSCGKCYTSGHQLKKHFKKYCGVTATQSEETILND